MYRYLALISSLVLTGPTLADTHTKPGGQEQATGTTEEGQFQHQLKGKILKQKQVSVRGTDAKHTVVLLQTDQNARIVADLGPTKQLDQGKIKEGEKITVSGNFGRVEDRAVLFADTLAVAGATTQIDRPEQQRVLAQRQQRQQQQATGGETGEIAAFEQRQKGQLKGEIAGQKSVGVKGKDQQNQVVLLRTDQGNAYVVDLGPEQNLAQVEVKQGTPIQVEGTLTRVGDRLVMMADQVTIGGKSVAVQRQPAAQPQQPATEGG